MFGFFAVGEASAEDQTTMDWEVDRPGCRLLCGDNFTPNTIVKQEHVTCQVAKSGSKKMYMPLPSNFPWSDLEEGGMKGFTALRNCEDALARASCSVE